MFSRRKQPVPGRIDTLIARGAVLQGDLAFAGGLHLDGRVVGRGRETPDAASATLWVGEPGSVEGGVEARHVVIHGTIKGDVHGTERVVLGATARITGDVHYGAIEMTLGARVDGKLVPSSPASGAAAADVPMSNSPGGAPALATFDPASPRA
jgi:cytoskeletal protein CcmA (bactofilin family)